MCEYVSVCGCVHATACIRGVRDYLWESVLSCHHDGPGIELRLSPVGEGCCVRASTAKATPMIQNTVLRGAWEACPQI